MSHPLRDPEWNDGISGEAIACGRRACETAGGARCNEAAA